jgi:hypothetical protein
VWWPGNGDKAVAEDELGGGITHAQIEGENKGGGCSENRREWPPFIGEVRQCGEVTIIE